MRTLLEKTVLLYYRLAAVQSSSLYNKFDYYYIKIID